MRIVLTGATGRLGAYLPGPMGRKGWEVLPWCGASAASWGDRPASVVDLTDASAIRTELDRTRPDAVLHVAAISDAETCRREPERARLVNVEATAAIAGWCRDRGRRLVFTSTDMVFDGRKPWPSEADEPRPILAYGATKRDAEIEALKAPDAVVARLALLYGPSRSRRKTFYDQAVANLREGVPQTFFEDEFRTPLDYATAAEALVGLLASDFRGPIHVAGRERLSRYELMRRVARGLGLDESLVGANRRADATFAEPRPADLSLDTSRLDEVLPQLGRPPVEEAVRAMERASGG